MDRKVRGADTLTIGLDRPQQHVGVNPLAGCPGKHSPSVNIGFPHEVARFILLPAMLNQRRDGPGVQVHPALARLGFRRLQEQALVSRHQRTRHHQESLGKVHVVPFQTHNFPASHTSERRQVHRRIQSMPLFTGQGQHIAHCLNIGRVHFRLPAGWRLHQGDGVPRYQFQVRRLLYGTVQHVVNSPDSVRV